MEAGSSRTTKPNAWLKYEKTRTRGITESCTGRRIDEPTEDGRRERKRRKKVDKTKDKAEHTILLYQQLN